MTDHDNNHANAVAAQLRLWEDPVGWTGSVREIVDDSPWDHDAMNASHEVEYWREA